MKKIVHLVFSLFMVVAISYTLSLHPFLVGLIGFGIGIGYMETKDK